jgi:hypothetical protein
VVLGIHSSNDKGLLKKRYQDIIDLIESLAEQTQTRHFDQLNVLILYSGVDGLTTDNTTWRYLSDEEFRENGLPSVV